MTTEMCQPQGYVVDQNAVIRFTYYALFTHPLRLIAHQFARLGSSFFDYLHTPKLRCRAAITGAAQKTCGGPGYGLNIISRMVFIFHCSTFAGRHFQKHPFQSPLHFCLVKIQNHLNEFLRGYMKCSTKPLTPMITFVTDGDTKLIAAIRSMVITSELQLSSLYTARL